MQSSPEESSCLFAAEKQLSGSANAARLPDELRHPSGVREISWTELPRAL
jgi:hypothetical protein